MENHYTSITDYINNRKIGYIGDINNLEDILELQKMILVAMDSYGKYHDHRKRWLSMAKTDMKKGFLNWERSLKKE